MVSMVFFQNLGHIYDDHCNHDGDGDDHNHDCQYALTDWHHGEHDDGRQY